MCSLSTLNSYLSTVQKVKNVRTYFNGVTHNANNSTVPEEGNVKILVI